MIKALIFAFIVYIVLPLVVIYVILRMIKKIFF